MSTDYWEKTTERHSPTVLEAEVPGEPHRANAEVWSELARPRGSGKSPFPLSQILGRPYSSAPLSQILGRPYSSAHSLCVAVPLPSPSGTCQAPSAFL